MATIFMAKSDEKPIGFYSAYALAASVSPIVVEIDVPVLEGVSNSCVFYADAIYSLFSMNNGIPKETKVVIGPYISRSANVVLNDLHAEVARRRLSGCELDHFLCFELDRVYGKSLVKEPMIFNDPSAPHFTSPGDCKNDPLIQKKWNMLLEGKAWDLDHLTLNQLIQELSVYKSEIDLHNRYYSFTANLVIRSLVELCINNVPVNVLGSGERSDLLEGVRIDKVGYLVFMDETAVDAALVRYPSLQKEKICSWGLRDVFEYFQNNPEYGIYFVASSVHCLFLDKEIVDSANHLFGEQKDNIFSTINKHKNRNNISICYGLYTLVMAGKMRNIDELKQYEDRLHWTDVDEQRLNSAYNAYLSDFTHHEKLDSNDMAKCILLEERFDNADTLEKKYISIILLYSILNWDNRFPYQTYLLICQDKLH